MTGQDPIHAALPPHQIERVKIEHIKGAVDVEILAVDVNEVAGACGAGKTSILDAIAMALGGARTHDAIPITIGENRGVVEVDTRDYQVVRVFRKKDCPGEGHSQYNEETGKMEQVKDAPDCPKCGGKGVVEVTTLTIKGKEGGRFGQNDLNKLLASLTFDPTEFITWDGKKRDQVLRQLAGEEWSAGLDTMDTNLTGSRSKRRTTRALIDNFNLGDEPPEVEGEDMASLTDGLKLAMNCEGAVSAENMLEIHDRREPDKVDAVDLGALYAEREAAVEHNHQAGKLAAEREAAENLCRHEQATVQRLEQELAEAQARSKIALDRLGALDTPEPLKSIKPITDRIEAAGQGNIDAKAWADWAEKRKGLANAVDDAFKRLPAGTTSEVIREFTVEAAQAKLDAAQEHQAAQVARDAWLERKVKLDALEAQWESLAGEIRGHEQARTEHMKSANFPVEGLDLTDDGLTVGGIPFPQLNHGAQIDAAVSIGIALNPGLRIMFIQKGESMDQPTFERVAARAMEAQIQLWIATVDSKGEGHGAAIHISEGRRVDQVEQVEQVEQPEGGEATT
jgi:hypothetical protein